MKHHLTLNQVLLEDGWMITMFTFRNYQQRSSLVAHYVDSSLQTKMWGPTLPSSSVIFAKSTYASHASSHFIQLHRWKTWSLKYYLASKIRKCENNGNPVDTRPQNNYNGGYQNMSKQPMKRWNNNEHLRNIFTVSCFMHSIKLLWCIIYVIEDINEILFHFCSSFFPPLLLWQNEMNSHPR